MTTQSEANVPQKLWRLAWAILIAVVVIGTITLIVLAMGAADPHRAGPLESLSGPFIEGVGPNREYELRRVSLPDTPFTLELTGIIDPNSDPGAAWGISFGPTRSGKFGVYLNGYNFLSIPPVQSDFRPFIHVRSIGVVNKITIDAAQDRLVTVRINDEIAWQSTFILPQRATIYLVGGPASTAHFNIAEIALYAPQN